MDPEATWRIMMDVSSDLDEQSVAATDLLVWLAIGGCQPRTIDMARSGITDVCRSTIFRALDRLAELEG